MLSCFFCTSSFLSMEYVMIHMKLKHKLLMYSEVACNFKNCSSTYNSVYSLKRHIETRHINSPKHFETNTFTPKQKLESPSNITLLQPCNAFVDILSDTSVTRNDNTINEEAFKQQIFDSALRYMSKLYACSSLSRSLIHEIVAETSEFYNSTCLEILAIRFQNVSDLGNFFKIVQGAFANFRTEHMTIKYLKETNCLIVPKSIVIHKSITYGRINNKKQIVPLNSKITVVPIKLVLQKFLELPDVLSSTLSYIEECRKESSSITSIIQSKFWQSLERNSGNRIILPLVVFFDDVEINNPLGSRKCINKLGAVYCNIACLPPQYSSLLENIFLFQLHKTHDHNRLGNKKIFSNIIQQIIDLEKTGITVNVNDTESKIFFKLCFIAGDNLGLNTILGFVRSFNGEHCCRICMSSKNEMKTQVVEKVENLRTVEDYSVHCNNKTFGVVEPCVFNIIPDFHAITNSSVDKMHDLSEGICRYDMGKIIYYIVYTKEFVTVEVLNERIRFFNHSSNDKNIPQFTSQSIKRKMLILSASEMNYLVQSLSLFVGDLIPTGDEVWKLYLMLREIWFIVMSPIIHNHSIDFLEVLITNYLTLLLQIFDDDTLKFKHHILLHYPGLLRKYGPLKVMCSTRFEGKHHKIKENSKVVTTRLNPAFTLSFKHQLQLCHRFICSTGFTRRVICGPVISKLHFMDDYNSFKQLLPSTVFNEYNCVPWIKINGTQYNTNSLISIRADDFLVFFGCIKVIIIDEAKEVFFLFLRLDTIGHCQHLGAFQVKKTQEWGFISHKNILDDVVNNMHIMSDGNTYVPCNF